MPILPDPHRPFPDRYDDEQMDAAEQAWIRQCEADDTRADAEQADIAMSIPPLQPILNRPLPLNRAVWSNVPGFTDPPKPAA